MVITVLHERVGLPISGRSITGCLHASSGQSSVTPAPRRGSHGPSTLAQVRVAHRIDSRLRGALLLPAGVLAVHQLRYYLAYGSKAGAHLAASGHAYLSGAEPFALLCVALAAGAWLGRVATAWQRPEADTPILRLWAGCFVILLALYCCQELIEGALASGHAAGLAGILGHGGWIAIPAAAAIGAGLALALRVADCLVALVATLRARRPRIGHLAQRWLRRGPRDWRLVPLHGGRASRAPPLALSH